MKYKDLEELYNQIKTKEEENDEVNYIIRLYILKAFKDQLTFEALSDEIKRRLIEGVYYYWVQSNYPLDVTYLMAETIMKETNPIFVIKMQSGKLTVRDIAKYIVKNESYFDNATF